MQFLRVSVILGQLLMAIDPMRSTKGNKMISQAKLMTVTKTNATMKTMIMAFAAMLVLAFMATSAMAQSGKMISESGAWKVYRSGSGNAIVCFITSEPTKLEGDYDRDNRGETRVFVTHHGRGKDNRNVVSVVAGYKYMQDRDVTFDIDGKSFSLFSVDTRAWATKPSQDLALVKAMKRGNKLKVTGTSSRGNKTVDTYSLTGFTKAMQSIDKACS